MKNLRLDIKPLIKKIEFFSKRLIESEYSGEHRSFHRHKGLEFEDYRAFILGDDSTLIDWKASLRARQLLIRQYAQMKNLNIFILVDVSNSMLFSSVDKIKCEYAAELAASLSFYFLRSGDSVGIALFNDKIVKYLPPNFSSKQFFIITRILSNPKFYGGNFNLLNSLSYVNNFIRQGAIAIIISDFIGLDEKWDKSIEILSKKADIIAIIVRDPGDMNIKEKVGNVVVSDPFSDKTLLVDIEKIRADYEHNAKQKLEEIKNVFKKNKSESIELTTDKSFMKPIIKFLSERRTRWQ